jgi:hypothetical protein
LHSFTRVKKRNKSEGVYNGGVHVMKTDLNVAWMARVKSLQMQFALIEREQCLKIENIWKFAHSGRFGVGPLLLFQQECCESTSCIIGLEHPSQSHRQIEMKDLHPFAAYNRIQPRSHKITNINTSCSSGGPLIFWQILSPLLPSFFSGFKCPPHLFRSFPPFLAPVLIMPSVWWLGQLQVLAIAFQWSVGICTIGELRDAPHKVTGTSVTSSCRIDMNTEAAWKHKPEARARCCKT